MSQPPKDEAIRRFKTRHGHLPGQKPTAAVPPLTAEQARVMKEVIGPAGAASVSVYDGPDYLSLIEAKKREKGIGYIEAAAAVLRTVGGRAARADYLRKKNPGIDI